MRKAISGLFFIYQITLVYGQNPVSTIPLFPTQNDTVTLVYDTKLGNRALENFSGSLYAHTGVITNLSTTSVSWRHVQGNWGTDDARMRMDSIGNGIYTLKIHIRSFYNVPANENVLRLGMVFRNQDGTVVGRAEDGSDIFVQVFDSLGLHLLSRNIPSNSLNVLSLTDSVNLDIVSSEPCVLQLFRNDTLILTANDSLLGYQVIAPYSGTITYTVIGNNGTNADTLIFNFFVKENPNTAVIPPGFEDGVTYLSDTSVLLVLYAPMKKSVFAIGDFNNWELNNKYQLNKTPDSLRYWIQINGLQPGIEYAYQFLVDGELRIADYYTEKILDPNSDRFIPSNTYPNLKAYPTGKTNGIVSVLQTAKPSYTWNTTQFTPPAVEDLVIYELLVRDFTSARNYKTLIDTLEYLQRLGINALKLMPVMEFENNESWGYNPSFYFAADKFYGTEYDLRALIDSCHGRGMAVILDIVLNHSFGQSPMVQMYFDRGSNQPLPESPWFNPLARHPFNVGFDFNHESEATQYFMNRVMKFWVEEYRIDGYRFDLSKGFTQFNSGENVSLWNQYDSSRVRLWKRAYDSLQLWKPGFYTILEHFAVNSEEKELADYGLMFWGNLNFSYNQITMGYVSDSDISGASYRSRNWNLPHLISYMESHDEERLMFKNIQFGNSNGTYNTRDLKTALERMKLGATLFFPIPGPKMIWQFGELGYDISINQNGRTGNKPILWNYLQDPERKRLYTYYRSLITLRKSWNVFRTNQITMNTTGFVKSIRLTLLDSFAIAVGNIDVRNSTANLFFPAAGWWYGYVSGDSMWVQQSGNRSMTWPPGAYEVWTNFRVDNPFKEVMPDTRDFTGFDVFPNPASEFIDVSFDHAGGDFTLRLFDSKGRLVSVLESSTTPSQGRVERRYFITSILNQNNGSGMYILELQNPNGKQSRKIAVDRGK